MIALIRGQMAPRVDVEPYRFSLALHPPTRLPLALNSFGLWVSLMIGLTLVNYGFPIARLIALPEAGVLAVFLGAG